MTVTEKQLANLIPNSERTPSYRKEKARKMGIASGKARNWKAEMKKRIGDYWDNEVTDAKDIAALKKEGLPLTNFGMWLLKILQRSPDNPQILHTVLEIVDALNAQQNNVTVNAVPIILGGENELK